jgi:hypothetical protein
MLSQFTNCDQKERWRMKISFVLACVLLLLAPAGAQSKPKSQETSVSHRATGTFEVKLAPLAPYNQDDKSLARFSIDKQFHGDLEATSKGEMLSAGSAASSGGYVAIEKVTGKLNGRTGSFVMQHDATMDGGKPALHIIVVPGSGSGALTGLSGEMDIIIESGKHSYVFNYTLP